MATVPHDRRVQSNPHNKKKNGSKKPKAKNPTKPTAKKKNPQKCNPKRKRNPQYLKDPKQLVIGILAGLVSAVGTRQLPQMILKASNTGLMGYLYNAIAGAGLTFAAHEFLGENAAQASLIGSGVIIADRILTEQFSPIGQYLALAGAGDATAATSLGQISEGFFVHPVIYDKQGNPIIPHQITDAAVKAFQALQPPAPANPAPTGYKQIAAPAKHMVQGQMQGAAPSRFRRGNQ